MVDICITAPGFIQSKALTELLKLRRLNVSQEAQSGCHTLVMGGVLADQKATLELGRKLGAKRIIIIDGKATKWSLTEEMGGRMVLIGLPETGLSPLSDATLIMVANLIAAPFGAMISADPATNSLVAMAERVAKFDVSVFINGPTGSGKEVLSRLIHSTSPRADKPFVAINCAAIPENMLEAMLFGYEKGAFTGATGANQGHIRAAAGGTLLLDEISEMPLALQAKLLRVIQEKVVTPLGSQTEIDVDIRILATSNRHMETEIARGNFREDLYFRLNVFPLETLALAARSKDVPVLAQALLQRHTPSQMVTPLLSPKAITLLCNHSWPGNVRELENVMQRALVLTDNGDITPEQIMLNATPAAIPLSRVS